MLYICTHNCNCNYRKDNKRTTRYIMKARVKTYEVNRDKAVELVSNHNCVSRDVASGYSDSELKEVLRHMGGRTFRFKANF